MKQIKEATENIILELTNKNYKIKSTDENEDYSYAYKTLNAYLKIIKIIANNNFIKLKMPDIDTALFKRLVLFAKIAELQKMGIDAFMEKAFNSYNQSWCENIFHRPYPPLPVVCGEKSILRLIRGW